MLEALSIAAIDGDLRVDVHAAELGERAGLWTNGAHGLDKLERALTSALAEKLHVGCRRRVARGEHRLLVRELRRAI